MLVASETRAVGVGVAPETLCSCLATQDASGES